jgi:hypothetical protein
VSLGGMVGSINFDLKIAPQLLFFSITSKPKTIEIPTMIPRLRIPQANMAAREARSFKTAPDCHCNKDTVQKR